MAVLVKANLEDVIPYKGKNISTKVGNKKQQVLFRVEADDFSLVQAIEHSRVDKNVVMIDFAGTDNYIKSCVLSNETNVPYIGVPVEVGLNLTESDIANMLMGYPEWVTLIIKLPDEYKDIQFLTEMCHKYPRIRFCGGYTFNIDGCRVGCCGKDIVEKLDIKLGNLDYIHQGCSCAFETVSFNDIEIVATQKAERSSNTGGNKNKSKSKSTAPRKAAFSALLSRGESDF